VQAIRAKRPAIPILVLVDHLPSACEEEAMQDCGVRIVRRLPQSRGVLLEAMWRLVERLTCLLVFWPVDAESVLLFL
jgi:hypothetical protein